MATTNDSCLMRSKIVNFGELTLPSYAAAARNTTRSVWYGHQCPTIPAPTLEAGSLPVPKVTPPTIKVWRRPAAIKPQRETNVGLYQRLAFCGRIVDRPSKVSDKVFTLYLKNRFSPRGLLNAARDAYIVHHTKKEKVVYADIPRGVAQPTSGKQQKKRSPSSAFEKESNASHWTLDELASLVHPIAPRRNKQLLQKLRVRIILLQARRTRGANRLDRFVKYMTSVERYASKAEAQGLFTPKVTVGVSKEAEGLIDKAVSKITDGFQAVQDSIGSKIVTNIASVAGILLTAATSNTRLTWITGILSSLAVTGLIQFGYVHSIASSFSTTDTKQPVSPSTSTGKAEAPDSPMDKMDEQTTSENVASGLTLLFQGIGTYCGLSEDLTKNHNGVKDWAKLFTKNLQFQARSTIGMFTFFKNFMYLLKKMAKAIFCYFNPDVQPLLAFWEHSEVMRNIFKECDEIMKYATNEFSDPEKINRLEALITLMTEIIVRISSFDQGSNGAQLLNVCVNIKSRLLTLRKECHSLGHSAVARCTPYCLYMHGESGIGKSTVLNDLAKELSEAAGVSENVKGKVYSRVAGMKYFDGHHNQEIIAYDDFAQMNPTSPDNTDIQELFQMITDQPFRPNMAEIENKGKIIDVKLVLIASNFSHPTRTWLGNDKALHRRRNMLVNVVTVGTTPTMNTKFDPQYKHLQFHIYDHVEDVQSRNIKKTLNFEDFVKYVRQDVETFREAEMTKVNKRLQTMSTKSSEGNRQPLSVEHLEQLLLAVLADEKSRGYSKWFTYDDAKKKAKEWLQRTFPFMYSEKVSTEDRSDEFMDKALAIEDLQKIEITKDNFSDYMTPGLWKTTSPEQRELVKKFWSESSDDEFPYLGEAQGTPGYYDTYYANKINKDKERVKLPVGIAEDELKMFPAFVYPMSASFIARWILDDRRTNSKLMEGWVKIIEQKKDCQHVKIDPSDIIDTITHSGIVKPSSGKLSLFKYFACHDNCFLKVHCAERLFDNYFPGVVKNIKVLNKSPSVQSGAKIAKTSLVFVDATNYEKIKKWIHRMFDKMKPVVKKTLKWFWQLVKWLLYLIVPVLTLVTLIFSWKSWGAAKTTSKDEGIGVTRALAGHVKQQYSDIYTTRGKSLFNPYAQDDGLAEAGYTVTPRLPGGTSVLPQHIATAQAGSMEVIQPLINKATTFMHVMGRSKLTDDIVDLDLRVVRIGGEWILMPKHYITYMRSLKTDTLHTSIIIANNDYSFNFSTMRFVNISNSEMILVHIANLPRSKDIRAHFSTEATYSAAPIPTRLNILEKKRDAIYIHKVNSKLVQNFTLTCFGDKMLTLPEVLTYDWAGAGRCMSAIFDDMGNIRGFHIAGNDKRGYGQIVTRDLLLELGSFNDPPTIPMLDPFGCPAIEIDTNVEPIGVVEGKYAVHIPATTSIRRSEIHGVFPVTSFPAPLRRSADMPVDPLLAGVRKHGMPPMGFDSASMKVAEQRYTEYLISVVKPHWNTVEQRSMDMAIRGVEGTTGFRSLVLRSSEGFPYMCMRKNGVASKNWLIHQHIESDNTITFGLHDLLLTEYNKNMTLRKNDIIPPTIFVDCLKDERLPLAKINIPGKTRVFSIAPTDFIIAFRQYFADFVVSFTKSRFDIFHAIGIAPERTDWTDLVRHLSVVGDKYLCGDYKNFGPGFDHGTQKMFYRAILKWYDHYSTETDALKHQEDQTVRKIIQIELSECLHLARNVVYKTYSGMASGSPSTAIDNSGVNSLYIFMAWYDIMSRAVPQMATLDAMLKYLRFVVYGDDIIMCVNDSVIEYFNNISLQQYFASFNIEYTDALKTGIMEPYCSLDKATFLKRHFIPHPFSKSHFLGALDTNAIEDCANWVMKSNDVRAASLEASYACLQLAYGHGPVYFDYIRRKLVDAWRKRDVIFVPRTWNDYELMYRHCSAVEVYSYIGEAQGPPTVTPGETTVCEESKDTVIQDHAPADAVCPPITQQHIIDWAGADYDAGYERVINRYILVGTYNWTTNDLPDAYLHNIKTDRTGKVLSDAKADIILPLDALLKNANTPTAMPFLQHKYANFDMDIKVITNLNKFMVGQLQVSWYYLHKEDAGYSFRDSIYSRSQLLHAVIDAGSSNTAELCIPYKNYRPWIHIGNDANLGDNAILGRLCIKVLSQLSVPSTTYNKGVVSVYVKFKNGNFMGVVPRDINTLSAEGEMLPMLTTMAASYLMQKMADNNRDKPPVQLPPQHMQPMATSSLALGTGCSEPLHALRLDARGQCPHPDSGDSDMDILNIAQKNGLLTTFIWSSDNYTESVLWKIEVTPTPDRSIFQTVKINDGLNAYCPPPISIMSGLMSEWRGSIEFVFSVVGSQYHTGRLLCCFIPKILNSITLAQAQSLPYVVFDIHDERTFSFVTPYIADKPWWPCGYLNGQKDQPPGIGTLFLLVLNPLIPMDSVAKQVQVLVYMKAHPSFELAIPRQSVWGLPWNSNNFKKDVLYAADGYSPWFVSGWRYLFGGNRCILRYGEVTDHVTQFRGMKAGSLGVGGGWYYYILDEADSNYNTNKDISFDDKKLQDCAFIPIDVNDGYGLIYMGVIKKTSLKIGTSFIFPANFDGKLTVNKTNLETYASESGYVTGNPGLLRKLYPNGATLEDLALSSSSGEGDIQICETTPMVKTTNCGMDLFGESYRDAKDYLRRYEPMFRIPFNAPRPGDPHAGKFQFSFDCIPAGHDVELDNVYANTSRDGGQAIIASCFRFFRGSMNYKLISNQTNMNIWIEHRPDRKVSSLSYRPAGITDRDTRWTKNYAQTVIVGSVNKIMTINVPFYQMGTLGLLQRPNLKTNEYALRAYSVGEILLGVEQEKQEKGQAPMAVDVLRSIGDDMRFYTYTGFPCMLYIGDFFK